MAHFGRASRARLVTCDARIQEILEEAIIYFDFTVVCGHRDEAAQAKAFEENKSKVQWPDSKHNSIVSKAVDIAPWDSANNRIDWNNRDRFIYLAAYVMGIATQKGYVLRWGGDWDSDTYMRDQSFNDLPHLELVD